MQGVKCRKIQNASAADGVKETPLIFSTEMVLALLEGRKWQTRRIVGGVTEGAFWDHRGYVPVEHPPRVWSFRSRSISEPVHGAPVVKCRYGTAGDRVWVREAWNVAGVCYGLRPSLTRAAAPDAWRYKAGNKTGWAAGWRPSIHMPRWACRLEFPLLQVRLERLQDISEADAKAEGVAAMEWFEPAGLPKSEHYHVDGVFGRPHGSYRNGFATLWEKIHGPGAWKRDPWVWVLELDRSEK